MGLASPILSREHARVVFAYRVILPQRPNVAVHSAAARHDHCLPSTRHLDSCLTLAAPHPSVLRLAALATMVSCIPPVGYSTVLQYRHACNCDYFNKQITEKQ